MTKTEIQNIHILDRPNLRELLAENLYLVKYVLSSVMIFLLLTYLVNTREIPTYTIEASLSLHKKNQSDPLKDFDYVEGQVYIPNEAKIITSTLLLERAIEELKNRGDAAFEHLTTNSLKSRIKTSFSPGRDVNIFTISFNYHSPDEGIIILNSIIESYINWRKQARSESISYSLEIVDNKLSDVQLSMKAYEDSLIDIRQTANSLDLNVTGLELMKRTETIEDEINDLDLKVIYLEGVIRDLDGSLTSIIVSPESFDIRDPLLRDNILKYNEIQHELSFINSGVTQKNSRIQALENQRVTTKANITQSIQNLASGYQVQKNELSEERLSLQSELKRIPDVERQLQDVSRKYKVQEGLYEHLLKIRAETEISLANLRNSVQVLSSPNLVRVNSKKQINYIIAFILGMIMPVALSLVYRNLSSKVHSQYDLSSHQRLKIVASINPRNFKLALKKSKIFDYELSKLWAYANRDLINSKRKTLLLVDVDQNFSSRNLAIILGSYFTERGQSTMSIFQSGVILVNLMKEALPGNELYNFFAYDHATNDIENWDWNRFQTDSISKEGFERLAKQQSQVILHINRITEFPNIASMIDEDYFVFFIVKRHVSSQDASERITGLMPEEKDYGLIYLN